jgi:hypothetical protein
MGCLPRFDHSLQWLMLSVPGTLSPHCFHLPLAGRTCCPSGTQFRLPVRHIFQLIQTQAMIKLGRDPDLFAGLALAQCGLLFLATPHSGAAMADWNPYLVQLSQLAGLRAVEFTRILEAFNSNSVTAKEDFGRLRPVPPFICLHETRTTAVAGINKLVSHAHPRLPCHQYA